MAGCVGRASQYDAAWCDVTATGCKVLPADDNQILLIAKQTGAIDYSYNKTNNVSYLLCKD